MSRLSEDLRRHLSDPVGAGEPVGGHDRRGEARNAACRDHLVLYWAVEHERVARAGFRATGCPAVMAYGSVAVELLPGLPAGPGLPARLRAAIVERHGEPAALHRHALALVDEALADEAPV